MNYIFALFFLLVSGCSYDLNKKNIVDRSAEGVCRTEFEFQKLVGHTDCLGMAHVGCHMVVVDYFPVAQCNTPDNEFKQFFSPETKFDEKSPKPVPTPEDEQ